MCWRSVCSSLNNYYCVTNASNMLGAGLDVAQVRYCIYASLNRHLTQLSENLSKVLLNGYYGIRWTSGTCYLNSVKERQEVTKISYHRSNLLLIFVNILLSRTCIYTGDNFKFHTFAMFDFVTKVEHVQLFDFVESGAKVQFFCGNYFRQSGMHVHTGSKSKLYSTRSTLTPVTKLAGVLYVLNFTLLLMCTGH